MCEHSEGRPARGAVGDRRDTKDRVSALCRALDGRSRRSASGRWSAYPYLCLREDVKVRDHAGRFQGVVVRTRCTSPCARGDRP